MGETKVTHHVISQLKTGKYVSQGCTVFVEDFPFSCRLY